MAWPPRIGEPLPRAREAAGIRRKLLDYSLNPAHERGGPKARGFERILGITVDHVDHLEAEIRAGILIVPVSSIRGAIPTGFNCVVDVPIGGHGAKSHRLIAVRTVWLLAEETAAPRMTTAFVRP
jgi:filamentous hemagglutinin